MKYANRTLTLMTAALLALAAVPAQAQEEGLERDEALERNAEVINGDSAAEEKVGWITLIGTIRQPETDAFQLEIGDAQLTVEMNDFRSHRDAAADTDDTVEGDSVVVTGPVHAELFSKWTLEATEIHFSNFDKHMSSAAPGMDNARMDDRAMNERADRMRNDRADLGAANAQKNNDRKDHKNGEMRRDAAERKAMNVETARGTITSVNEASDQFTVDTGDEEIVVKTGELEENPFTGDEDARIALGDRVVVTGYMKSDADGEKHLQATQVVTTAG